MNEFLSWKLAAYMGFTAAVLLLIAYMIGRERLRAYPEQKPEDPLALKKVIAELQGANAVQAQIISAAEANARTAREELNKLYKAKEADAQEQILAPPAMAPRLALGKAASPVSPPDYQQQAAICLELILDEQRAFRKNWHQWMTAMFGNAAGNSYEEVTDEEAKIKDDAAALVARYSISWEEALKRAKMKAVYKTGGMGGAA